MCRSQLDHVLEAIQENKRVLTETAANHPMNDDYSMEQPSSPNGMDIDDQYNAVGHTDFSTPIDRVYEVRLC
jgi:hypothetical protein